MNTVVTVPMVLPIITVVCSPPPLWLGEVHTTDDEEVQIDVEHVSVPIWPDGVESLRPKLMPEKETAAPVVDGPLVTVILVMTGASKLNTALCVPTDPSR